MPTALCAHSHNSRMPDKAIRHDADAILDYNAKARSFSHVAKPAFDGRDAMASNHKTW